MTKRTIIRTTEQAEAFLTERGVTLNGDGTCTVRLPGCGRCGGSGWGGWSPNGGACYECNPMAAPRGSRPPRKVRRDVIAQARAMRDKETRERRVARERAEREAAYEARKAERQAKWAAEKAERAAKFEAECGNSKHVAKIGERVEVTATVRSVREFTYISWGYNGCECTGQVVNFVTTDGDVVVWFNKGAKFESTEGGTVKVRGTVKKHGEYQGVAQTTMQRVKVAA